MTSIIRSKGVRGRFHLRVAGLVTAIVLPLFALGLGSNPADAATIPAWHLTQYSQTATGKWTADDATALTGGTEPISGSAASYMSGGVLNAFVEGLNGHLLQYVETPTGSWTVYDITQTASGNETVAGTPAVYVNSGGVVNVFVEGTNGHLLQYYKTPTGPWQVYDLTLAAGGTETVAGTPAVYVNGGGVVNVFVDGTNGHLLQYINTGSWQVYDLTQAAGGTQDVAGTPAIYVNGGGFNLFVTGTDGHLLQFANTGSWQVWDLTDASGGTETVTGTPAVYVIGGGFNLFVEGTNDDLLQFANTGSWQVWDLTKNAGSSEGVWTSPTVNVNSAGVVSVYVMGGNDLLRYHNTSTGWQVVNVTTAAGSEPNGDRVFGPPAVNVNSAGDVSVLVDWGLVLE